MRKLIFILSFLYSVAYAQYVPMQSQYLFNGVALNPAATGSEDAFSLVGSFRAQWLGFDGAPTTQSITAHAPMKKQNSALGVQFFADQIGVSRNTGIFGSYAYRLRFKRSQLAFGISGGIFMFKSYYSQLNVNDLDDGEIAVDSPLGVLPDASFGIHFHGEKYFLSLSAPYFLSHDFDGSKFRITNDFKNYNLMFGGGYEFHMAGGNKFKPSVLLKYRYNNPLQTDFNLVLTANKVVDIGLSYRTDEALIALLEIRPTKQFSFMYSLGFPLSPLWRYTYGSHEFSLKYNFLYKSKMSGPRFLGW
ncbi:MAG: type IX secretion system membrane protein PorP/SprF [Flavobacteriales bacterium]|nr:type IX secretion system membrane protein PorP/SprF [Flavobacteriales bacterium]